MKFLIALTLVVVTSAGCSGGGSSTAEGGTAANQPITENEDLSPGLKGVDATNNGIRDDIDRLIARKYSATPEIQRAVEQRARALQKFLEVTTKDQARAAGQDLGRAISCTFKVFPSSNISEDDFRTKSLREIEALTSNTKERFSKYWESNRLAGGMNFPQAHEPVCD